MPRATKAARTEAAGALAELRAASPPIPAAINKAIAEIPSDVSGGEMNCSAKCPGFAFVALIGDDYPAEFDHPGAVEVTDLTCPPGLPGASNGTPVTREVKLHD